MCTSVHSLIECGADNKFVLHYANKLKVIHLIDIDSGVQSYTIIDFTVHALRSPMRSSATPKDKPALATRSVKAASAPSMRFFHSKALRTRTNMVLDAIEAAPAHPQHAEALASLVAELVEAGSEYYFLRALKLANVGFMTEQSARLGMSGAMGLINTVSKKFIIRMDPPQLLVVAAHIRSLA
jgi:hypothetical protein